MEEVNQLSQKVIGGAIHIHKEMGPGLYESVYHNCMMVELRHSGLAFEHEMPVSVSYRGTEVAEDAFRMDFVVEDLLVLELKSVEEIKPVHKKQLLTYLRLAKKPLGLLINFNEEKLMNGVTRIINSDALGA
jgi:GxxExxY protein